GAARGEVVEQYPGGFAGRAREIDDGAHRPAPELVADVRASNKALETVCTSLPPQAWGGLTRDVSGVERPAAALVRRRWREVEVHHVDLALGYGPSDWA